jgi:hypothetical protein
MQDAVLFTGDSIEHQSRTTLGIMHNRRWQTHNRLAVTGNDLYFQEFILPPLATAGFDKQSAKPQISAKTGLDWQTMFVQQQLKLDWLANTATVFHIILL